MVHQQFEKEQLQNTTLVAKLSITSAANEVARAESEHWRKEVSMSKRALKELYAQRVSQQIENKALLAKNTMAEEVNRVVVTRHEALAKERNRLAKECKSASRSRSSLMGTYLIDDEPNSLQFYPVELIYITLLRSFSLYIRSESHGKQMQALTRR